jgi:hypothetical protein
MVFQSLTECKNDCKNNLGQLINNNSSLPDLVVKILDIAVDPPRGYSMITASIKNIGGGTATCRPMGVKEMNFR